MSHLARDLGKRPASTTCVMWDDIYADRTVGSVLPCMEIDGPLEMWLRPDPELASGWIASSPWGVSVFLCRPEKGSGLGFRPCRTSWLTLTRAAWEAHPALQLNLALRQLLPDASAHALDHHVERALAHMGAPKPVAWGLSPFADGAVELVSQPDLPMPPDPKWVAHARDSFAEGCDLPAGDRDHAEFEKSCDWFDAAFALPIATTGADPRREALYQANSILRFRSKIAMPSAIALLKNHPHLAAALAKLSQAGGSDPVSPMPLGAIIARSLDHLAQDDMVASGPSLASVWRTDDWRASPWGDGSCTQSVLRAIMRMLALDAVVADIDTHWGQGSALRLGQVITKHLRSLPQTLPKLTEDMPVMGRA